MSVWRQPDRLLTSCRYFESWSPYWFNVTFGPAAGCLRGRKVPVPALAVKSSLLSLSNEWLELGQVAVDRSHCDRSFADRTGDPFD